MSITNIHDAKTKLSSLIAAAERGEEVIIARAGKPVVKIVACGHTIAEGPAASKLKQEFGAWKGRFEFPPWEDWKNIDEEIEVDFAKSIDERWP